MGPADQHVITDIESGPGELSFRAQVGGLDKRLFIRSSTAVTPNADAVIPACLMPAMTSGGALRIDAEVSPRLLRTQREYGAIQRAWSAQWTFGQPQLREVSVTAAARPDGSSPPTGRVAAFFSGGVDSWSTLLDNPDITDLIFIRGVDLLADAAHQVALAEEVELRLHDAAAALGLPLHVIEVNLRELSDPLVHWEAYYPSALAAVALFLQPLFDRVLIAGVNEYANQARIGPSHLADHLWSNESLEIADDGGRYSRAEKTARIADHRVVQRTLRVCWENPGGAYNCGRCRKCLMTMATLEATGKRNEMATFPQDLDLDAVAAIRPLRPVALILWEDVLDAARAGGNDALMQAVEAVVKHGRDSLGAPDPPRNETSDEGGHPTPADQAITELRAQPGELSFRAQVGGLDKRLFIRTDTPVTPNADAALAACLVPAMRTGGTLRMSDPVSPRLLRTQREFQAIQRTWSKAWEFGEPPLREAELTAPARELETRRSTGRVASFFSAGVDSWWTVLDDPEVTDLIFVRGVDLLPGAAHQAELADEVEARVREAAELLGLRLHAVETNLRELYDPLVRWENCFACPLAAIALFFAPLFDRVMISGDTDYETEPELGTAWTINSLWSTDQVEIVDAGGRCDRMERIERISAHPVVQRTLRVCWENPGGAYNCGRCRKCVGTMAALQAIGALGSVHTFPDEVDLDLVRNVEMSYGIVLIIWEDLLQTARDSGDGELAEAVEESVVRGREKLGYPPTYRGRQRPAAVQGTVIAAQPPQPLFATPETAAALASARSAAFLIGGFDGSGNFGDITQLDAALGLLAPLAPGLLVVPVLERAFAEDHRRAVAAMTNPPAHALFFGTEPAGDGLVPVGPPPGLAYAACYLYGGGYLNPDWGDRKLALLGAAETIAMSGGTTRLDRLSSGLQVDPGWIAGLSGADQRVLRAFALHGGRDQRSSEALAALEGIGVVIESGDDAVGLLAVATAEQAPDSERLRVNVHFAEHEWVTGDPAAMLRFHAGFLAELGRLGARPLQVQPLLAYVDSRIDESTGLDRLASACAERGIELLEPLLLRPAALASEAEQLRLATLTVSCSYHVSLASLLLGVPALLLADNPYYEQKAAGLARDFGLPEELAAGSDDDPAAVAARSLSAVEGENGAALRRRLAVTAANAAARRSRAEAAIAAHLGAGALAVLGGDGGGPAVERELAAADGRAAAAAERAEAAEQSAVAAHAQLGQVLGSRSWRLLEPLRRAARAGRGRR